MEARKFRWAVNVALSTPAGSPQHHNEFLDSRQKTTIQMILLFNELYICSFDWQKREADSVALGQKHLELEFCPLTIVRVTGELE
ncbi:unnamed protein product [Nezara viridula]|uniref:Uncharacterized protein n=1 Tax=Nezara viridula TaxID=85310 RepID=A0A9P0HKD8_NEZVI|nr:unnamed protein product [Nezara viridula]